MPKKSELLADFLLQPRVNILVHEEGVAEVGEGSTEVDVEFFTQTGGHAGKGRQRPHQDAEGRELLV